MTAVFSTLFASFANQFAKRLRVVMVQPDPTWRKNDIDFLRWQLQKIYRQIPNAPTKAHIEILFTHDQQMRQLKKDFLRQDQATNVLSFPNHHRHNAKELFLGSIALGHGVIKKESRAMGKKFRHHLTHLAIHGLLHLLDFDHANNNDAEKMEALEVTLLARIGIANPYQ